MFQFRHHHHLILELLYFPFQTWVNFLGFNNNNNVLDVNHARFTGLAILVLCGLLPLLLATLLLLPMSARGDFAV